MSEYDNPDGDSGIVLPPQYVMVLGEKLPGIVAELLVETMMESGEDPRNAALYALRKAQITWGAGKVEPDEVERCIAAAPPWPAWLYQRDQEKQLRKLRREAEAHAERSGDTIMTETQEQFDARHRDALPADSWERERIGILERENARIAHLERQLAERDAEIARFRSEGVPGVMHDVDKSFYDLAISERNYARVQVVNRDATIAQLRRRLELEG